MKLYGAKVSQDYIQYTDGKKRHIRYPRSEEYPHEAREQERRISMNCKDYPYHYLADGDRFPTCHFHPMWDGDLAPCEYDDYSAEEEYEV